MATDVQDQWIARVLGIDVAVPGPPAADETAYLNERLAGIIADVKLYNAVQIAPAVKEAASAIKARAPDAAALIATLEEQVFEAGVVFRRAEVRSETAKGGMGKAGVVAFAKTRLRWNETQRAMGDAIANVSDGLRALIETADFQDDPRSHDSDTPALIDALAARLPRVDQLGDAIDDALDADGSSPDARRKRIDAVLRAISTYEAELGAFDELRAFENTPAGSYPTLSLIEGALAGLKTALSAAAQSLEDDVERTAA